jgi:hypothetical protein
LAVDQFLGKLTRLRSRGKRAGDKVKPHDRKRSWLVKRSGGRNPMMLQNFLKSPSQNNSQNWGRFLLISRVDKPRCRKGGGSIFFGILADLLNYT